MVRFNELSAEHFIDLETPAVKTAANRNLEQTVLHIVKTNPEGVTASTVADALDVTPPTILKTLRSLEREREVYSRLVGRSHLWYANGRIIHPYLEVKKDFKGKPYRFSIQEGRSGPMVQVQERIFSLLEGERVEGAVFIDYEMVDDFIAALEEMKRRFETHQVSEVKK